jgi:hypothetical protein
LLPDRTGTPVVVTLEVAAQAAISYQEKKKNPLSKYKTERLFSQVLLLRTQKEQSWRK